MKILKDSYVYLPLILIVTIFVFCITYNKRLFASEYYLGGPESCNRCGYSIDIRHPSTYDCIDYLNKENEQLKTQLEECCQ